jgi:hypothetical protein
MGKMQSKAKENKCLGDSVPASTPGINAVNRKELPGFGSHVNARTYHPNLKKSLLKMHSNENNEFVLLS